MFNTDNPVAGLNDSETPNGMFFKDNDHDICLGGAVQMAVYLRMERPLHFRNREEANAWYRRNVPGYDAVHKQYDDAMAAFEPEFKEIEDEQFEPNTTDERVEELFEIEEKLIQRMGEVETGYRARLRELLNQHFLTGNSGYDGIELDYDGHRWVNGVRENVHTYIVFSPMQIKSATDNVGTFDPENDIKNASGKAEYSEHVARSLRVAAAVPALLQNAVEVNRSNKNATPTRPYAHVLMAVYEEAGEYYAVRMVVEHNTDSSTGELLKYDVIRQLHATNTKRIPRPSGLVSSNGAVLPRRQGDILMHRIAQLIRDVNSVSGFGDTFAKRAYAKFGGKRTESKFSRNLQYSERQVVTNTAAFREWFGDSKVVNEDGSPKVVYHQTAAAFTRCAAGASKKP